MSAKNFLTSFVAVFALFVAPLYAETRPNVLFIAIDDLNDFPTFTGRYPDAKTPHMDKLAKSGTVFTNAHCQFPLCGPSRASVMSGLYPWTMGYDHHMKDEALAKRAEELGSPLMHTAFSKQGYKTLAVGKICHKHVPKGSVDASGGRGAFNGGTGNLKKHWPQQGTSTDWAMAPERDEDLPDHQAATWAVEQLQQKHDQPFMMMVGILRPHVPFYVPKRWFDLYDKDKLTLPPYKKDDLDDISQAAKKISILPQMPRTDWAIEEKQWRNIVHAYLACISFADHQVGRVLEALEKSPYADNTIIVLWSDHGYHMGEKNTFQKHSLWERSSHVPVVISGPGLKPGQRCDRVVGLIDLYPTLLDLCDLPANPKHEGRSLKPLLTKPDLEWPHVALTGWKEGSMAMQVKNHRYIRYADGSEELYDHIQDPNEWHNVATPEAIKERGVRHEALVRWMSVMLNKELER